MRRILRAVYGLSERQARDLRGAGFRIHPGSAETVCRRWKQDPLPSWTRPYLFAGGGETSEVRYLLTFQPFGLLPASVRRAYLAGRLHLLPFPGSLIFWGTPKYLALQRELRLAMQIPLLAACERHEDVHGLRIPQTGWMHEQAPTLPPGGAGSHKMRNMYVRTSRWGRLERHQDELGREGKQDRIAHALFSIDPVDIELYSKPLARNAQVWTDRYRLLLDGPHATREQMAHAADVVKAGGQFGYRLFPSPMQVGGYTVFWHLPLVSYIHPRTRRVQVLENGPLGYLTGYRSDEMDLDSPVELWPQLQSRPELVAAVQGYEEAYGHRDHMTALNADKVVEVSDFLSQPVLPHDFVESLLTLEKRQTVGDWFREIARWKKPGRYGRLLRDAMARKIAPAGDSTAPPLPAPITYASTATRSFETAYWKTIARLSTGRFRNKDTADCVHDPPTLALLKHRKRDLEALGDWLLAYYRTVIREYRMTGKALAGDLPFRWQTEFDFPWMGGWRANREGLTGERNLLTVIPGRDRRRAVVLADHYDTAYMEDHYYTEEGGTLARVAAPGSDDNHSATAALMLGAPIFLELSRSRRLACDIWLLHLTGEEFPADSLGARHFAQQLAEGTLALHLPGRRPLDLSRTRVEGVFVMDMIAHNRRITRDVFQISPGLSRESYWLAYQAHLAAMIWNAGTGRWNRSTERRDAGRGKRSADGKTIPAIARHLPLHGEVRIPRDPRSSLFNTDGQIFSDVGIPTALFMENYDINRSGYHDSKDDMRNIDLDYGAALAAIAIEATARVACAPPGLLYHLNLFDRRP